MACCIFAAMIITNILVFYRKVKGFFGFKSNPDGLWQPKVTVPLWRRITRVALPVVMVGFTAAYGTLHWHHITAWMGPGNECNTAQTHHSCVAAHNQHHHH